jgi:hypothetical protein
MTTSSLPNDMAVTGALLTRKAMVRAGLIAGILIAGYVGMSVLERSLHLTFEKPPMPLTKPLAEMKKALGGGRYVADGPDEVMSEDVVDVLGTKDYLLRTYTDTTKGPNEIGAGLKLNLNYYATGVGSPHVPEICWAGTGMKEAPSSKKIFTVPGVHRLDGTPIDLKMRMISFLPQQGNSLVQQDQDTTHLLNVAYVFEVNGDYVSTPQEVTSVFWKPANKHAYHTKIELTVGSANGQPQYCTQEEAQKVISDFIRVALPAVEECLPAHDVAEGVGPKAEAPIGSNEGIK